jgi:hypothetical protein
MAEREKNNREVLGMAQWTCLLFGTALLIWGVAPLLVVRLVTHHVPTFADLAFSSVTLLIASAFLGFFLLIRRGVAWGMWAAATLSVVLLVVGATIIWSDQRSVAAAWPVVFATLAAVSNVFAIAQTRRTTRTSA